MPGSGRWSAVVLEDDVGAGNAERGVDGPALLDRLRTHDRVGAAGEEVNSAVGEIGRRVDFRLAGKGLDEVCVERDALEQKGRRHAGSGRLRSQRLHAVGGRMQDGTAV